jgi:hypothetical protein
LSLIVGWPRAGSAFTCGERQQSPSMSDSAASDTSYPWPTQMVHGDPMGVVGTCKTGAQSMGPTDDRHVSVFEIPPPQAPVIPAGVVSPLVMRNQEQTLGFEACVPAKARVMLMVWTAGTAQAIAPAAPMRRSA